MISRVSAWLLIAAGVFNVVIWPRFAKAIVEDDRAWAGERWTSAPQAFLWVHAVLIGVAMTLGVMVLVIGWRAGRSLSTTPDRDLRDHPDPASLDSVSTDSKA